jgi:hypothetical protein
LSVKNSQVLIGPTKIVRSWSEILLKNKTPPVMAGFSLWRVHLSCLAGAIAVGDEQDNQVIRGSGNFLADRGITDPAALASRGCFGAPHT